MKFLLGSLFVLAIPAMAVAQEISSDEILREIHAATDAQQHQGNGSGSLGASRSIHPENGVDFQRDPADFSSLEAPANNASTPPSGAPGSAAGAPPAAPRTCIVATTFRRIYFSLGSAEISSQPQTQETLYALADALASPSLNNVHIVVRGHTDASGSAVVNARLSRQRAQNVVRFLVAAGAPADRLSAVGRGSSELADAANPFGERNRRVDLCVYQ